MVHNKLRSFLQTVKLSGVFFSAVFLLLFLVSACQTEGAAGGDDGLETSAPAVVGPAFVLFYTDN